MPDLAHMDLESLWAAALREVAVRNDDEPVPYLVELHDRGSRAIFERAVAMCSSEDVDARLLGVLVLRELGGPPPIFAAEAMPVLLRALAAERTPAVIRWIISAIGYQHMVGHLRPRLACASGVLSAVLPFAGHDVDEVRFGVAAALPSLVDLDQPAESAIRALLDLTSDPSADNRYYALAGLYELGLCERADVHAMLELRADDLDAVVRREARRALSGEPF